MPAAIVRTASRMVNIVRYHRADQLGRRFWKKLSAPYRVRIPLGDVTPAVRIGPCPPNRYAKTARSMTLADLRQGRFCLLNLPADLGFPIAWDHPHWEAPPLWDFHLHYHEYLGTFAGFANPDWDLIWNVVEQWIDRFPVPTKETARLAWHPYCISRRLAVWTLLYRLHAPSNNIANKVQSSMARQAAFLRRNLERDIGGNHLWENAKALVTAGCFFEGPHAEKWLRDGLKLLSQCINQQLSAEGEHFEKAPTYQLDLAEGLVDLATILESIDAEQARWLEAVSQKMYGFLERICHADGTLPLFGDSTAVAVNPPTASTVPSGEFVGDYFVYRADNHRWIFDAGNVGPDELPAHAHADLLGFEASVFGRRLFVDSGIYAYTGPKRQVYRSTAAHNVLIVDDLELADTWASFRMGRRGHVIARQCGQETWGCWTWAAHDAYISASIGPVERLCVFVQGGPWFSIHLLRQSSKTPHRLKEHVHCHPDVSLIAKPDGALVTGLPTPLRIEVVGPAQCNIQPNVYSPDFYVELPNKRLEIEQTSALPAVSAWSLSMGEKRIAPQVAVESNRVTIRWHNGVVVRQLQLVLPSPV